jgi:hypothetical protein
VGDQIVKTGLPFEGRMGTVADSTSSARCRNKVLQSKKLPTTRSPCRRALRGRPGSRDRWLAGQKIDSLILRRDPALNLSVATYAHLKTRASTVL